MRNPNAPLIQYVSRAIVATALFCLASDVVGQQAKHLLGCVACHGAQGISPIPSIPSLAAQPKIFLENQMVLIREGLRDIPQMKGLLDGIDDAELAAMADYFQALQPPGAASTPKNANRFQRGKELARTAQCASCHRSDYSGQEQIPRLAGQHEVFLLDSMKQFRDHAGPGRDTVMSAALFGIKDNQLADLAHFFAHFAGVPKAKDRPTSSPP